MSVTTIEAVILSTIGDGSDTLGVTTGEIVGSLVTSIVLSEIRTLVPVAIADSVILSTFGVGCDTLGVTTGGLGFRGTRAGTRSLSAVGGRPSLQHTGCVSGWDVPRS